MAAPEPAPRRGREREREEESEDESDILEESPCGRWQKRREQVSQGNMPGVQSAFLAMDTEEGVEVVWNELHFGNRKAFAAHEEKIQTVFAQLALVDHPNIVKLHKYWLDTSEARARVVFITEYVSSGSLKQFLKKTKKNHKTMNTRVRGVGWGGGGAGRGWSGGCHRDGDRAGRGGAGGRAGSAGPANVLAPTDGAVRPLPGLEALVHTDPVGAQLPARLQPPHHPREPDQRHHLHPAQWPHQDRLRCWRAWEGGGGVRGAQDADAHSFPLRRPAVWHRIFSNALPDDLRSPIRTEREEPRNLHFFPPEYGEVAEGTAVDIFSFGMCALEMAVLEIQANGDARVTEEAIARARHSLGDPNMREFILSCLARDPACRPSAHSLLLHRVLFEVHSLKLLAAHCCIQYQHLMPENVVEEKAKAVDLHAVLAEIPRLCRPPLQWRYSEVPFLELGKFLEDVRTGLYPLMSFAAARPLGLPRALAPPPEEAQMAKTPTPELFDLETRRVTQMQCSLERSEDKARWHLTLLLVLEDRMHRQLTYDLLPTDSAQELATELVHYGFLHESATGGSSGRNHRHLLALLTVPARTPFGSAVSHSPNVLSPCARRLRSLSAAFSFPSAAPFLVSVPPSPPSSSSAVW